MRRICLWMILLLPVASLAAMYDKEYKTCNNSTTVDIVDCVAALTKKWDKQLNVEYKKLMGGESPQQVQLKTAQRLWIKYRDANCGYYAAGEGTISSIEAAECMRSMTKQRTCELQAQNQQETGPGPECQ